MAERLSKEREGEIRDIERYSDVVSELLVELDALRAELAHAVAQYDAMRDSRDAAKLEGDKLRIALAVAEADRDAYKVAHAKCWPGPLPATAIEAAKEQPWARR